MSASIDCPRCGRGNPADARYCNECGRPLSRPCPGCGATVPAEAWRCPGCGHALAARARNAPGALDGERKRVTVLFADLKSSMELLAGRDPEEAAAILETVISAMMDAVHLYEGTVNQVMGDGLMAMFGAPLAFEDHAVRACHAALAMTDALHRRAHDAAGAPPLQLRVGLNSGEVVVRTIGSDLHVEYTAVGETTHLAARMQQLAEPGTILMTGETLRLAEGHVEVEPVGPLPVKGLAEPVEAFALIGAAPSRTRWQVRVVRGLTPFVGRQEELAALADALHRADAGAGQVVALVGEPGVGKSRLVWEFTRSEPARRLARHEAGCISYGVATPYLPIRDILREYFELGAGTVVTDPHDVVDQRLRAVDDSLVPYGEALIALLELGPEARTWRVLDASERRHRIHEAVIELLIRQSRAGPVILVVEDLQWADSETRALLDRLVATLAKSRLLFVATHRPDHGARWSDAAGYREILVRPLSRPRADEMVRNLVGADAALAPLRRLVLDRTGGNPFFIEETVRTLTEAGTMHVPATVHAVLAFRIDRLSPADKHLLRTAAVIGRDVPLPLLRAVVERPEEELNGGLVRLEAAGFLRERRRLPEREYTFRHALIHDVAYEGLLHDLRRAMHARIVPAIEKTWPDRIGEHVDRLAEHALRGEVWDVALRYARLAGAKAAARSAHGEAVAWFRRALDALAHAPAGRARDEHAVELHLSLANSLLPIRDIVALGEHLQQAERHAREIDDRPRLARVSSFQSTYAWLRGRHEESVAYGRRALDMAAEFGDFGLTMNTHLALGEAYQALGRYREAIEILDRNVAALRGDLETARVGLVGLPSVLSRVWIMWSLTELGDFDAAVPIGDDAVRIAERADHPYSRIIAYFGTGGLHLRRGELAPAVAILERALALCRVWDTQLRQLYLGVAPSLAHAYALAGRARDAFPLLERSIEQAESAGMLYAQPLRYAWLADACVRSGRLTDARRFASRALDLARAQHERGHETWTLGVLADVAALEDAVTAETAAAACREALALADELGMRPRAAVAHLGLGRALRRAGRPADATKHLSAALQAFRTMAMPFWIAEAERDQALGG